jgi:predicted Zn-dependent peptidase
MKFEITTLDNGITVLTEHMADVRSICIGLWFSVGSRDELPREAGMSHFMEHMMFKGTPSHTAEQISTEFEGMGAELNAFTSKEYTCYFARFVDEKLPRAVELLGDMVTNSLFSQEEIEHEREVVIEEIARSEDTPDDYVFDLFSGALMPKHPLGKPIIGTRDHVSSFMHDDCVSYHERHYHTGNLTVVAAGNVDHAELVELCSRHLAGLRTGERTPRETLPIGENRSHAFLKKDTEQAHILYGVPSLPANHPDRFALMLVELVLGGGMSSRLFQEVREKRGLVYAIFASTTSYIGAGQSGVYAGTRPENITEVVSLIAKGMERIGREGITEDELARVRDFAKGQIILTTEDTRNNMLRLGKSACMQSELLTLDEVIARYDAVTLADANRVARDIYLNEPTLAIISPLEPDEVEGLL